MKGKKVFYGWVNLAVLWFGYAAVVSSIAYAFGVIVSDMADSLGMTMALATGAYTGYTLVHAVTAPLAGAFVNRFGAKKTILIGLGWMLLGCLLMVWVVRSVWLYYLFWILFVGFGMRFGTLLPSQVCVSKWFYRNRGLSMAILLTAGGIGGYLFTPLCSYVNAAFSWRYVWLLIAACTAVTILLVALLLKESPADVGAEIDNGQTGRADAVRPGRVARAYKTSEHWALKDVRRRAAFYLLIFLFLASSYQLSAISTQGINHLVLRGIEPGAAANAVGLFALINTLGRIVVGVLGDRAELKRILGVGAALSAVGFAALLMADTAPMAYLALTLSGLGYGIIMVAPQNMLLNYFGSHDYARINGLFSMAAGILAAFPAVIIGWFYDLKGNYTLAWVLGLVMMIVSLLIAVLIKPPVYKGSKADSEVGTEEEGVYS